MALTNTNVIRRLGGIFRISDGVPENYVPDRNINYSRNNVFNVSLRMTDRISGIPEFPVATGNYAVKRSGILRDFIVPMSTYRTTYIKRNTSSVFTTLMFVSFSMSTRICRVETSKGNIYYGGLGMILDRDMDPIMLTTFSKIPDTDVITRPAIRLRPDILYSDGEIERYVTKTVMPYILENGVDSSVLGGSVNYDIGRYMNEQGRIVPDIIISEDIRRFVIVPKVPMYFSDDDINDMLREKVDEVCDNILL